MTGLDEEGEGFLEKARAGGRAVFAALRRAADLDEETFLSPAETITAPPPAAATGVASGITACGPEEDLGFLRLLTWNISSCPSYRCKPDASPPSWTKEQNLVAIPTSSYVGVPMFSPCRSAPGRSRCRSSSRAATSSPAPLGLTAASFTSTAARS